MGPTEAIENVTRLHTVCYDARRARRKQVSALGTTERRSSSAALSVSYFPRICRSACTIVLPTVLFAGPAFDPSTVVFTL